MLSLILKVIGVLDAPWCWLSLLSICAIFLIVYVLPFYDYLKKPQDCATKIPRYSSRYFFILNAEELSKQVSHSHGEKSDTEVMDHSEAGACLALHHGIASDEKGKGNDKNSSRNDNHLESGIESMGWKTQQ